MFGQLRVVRAAGLEIGAYAEDDQGRGLVVRPVPDGGRGVQRGDERAPLLLIRALGEQLLELVNHQQQLPAVLRRRAVRVRRRAARVRRRAARLRQRRLSRGEREPSRIGVKPAPHFGRIAPASLATRTASSSSGARAGVNNGKARIWRALWTPARSTAAEAIHPPAAATTCPPPRPRRPPAARPVYLPRHPCQHLRGRRLAAEETARRVPQTCSAPGTGNQPRRRQWPAAAGQPRQPRSACRRRRRSGCCPRRPAPPGPRRRRHGTGRRHPSRDMERTRIRIYAHHISPSLKGQDMIGGHQQAEWPGRRSAPPSLSACPPRASQRRLLNSPPEANMVHARHRRHLRRGAAFVRGAPLLIFSS